MPRAHRHQRASFQYQQLEPDHIRLLLVTSTAKKHDTTTGSLELKSFPIGNLPYFLALSYAWTKSAELTRTLICNGKVLNISNHVYTCLKRISRIASAPCCFAIWVDAICINQEDATEKSRQVPLMGSIYGLASEVIIWLGENKLVDKHIVQVQRLVDNVTIFLSSCKGVPSSRKEYYEWTQTIPDWPPEGHELWKVISTIMSSRWFRRLWVVQEAGLGRNLLVLCGHCFVLWNSLTHFFSPGQPNASRLAERSFRAGISGYRRINLARGLNLRPEMHQTISGEVHYQAIINVLDGLRIQQVAKPIDRVYGLMFLLSEDVRKDIVVDYSQEREYWKAYLELARLLVAQAAGLTILAYAPANPRSIKLPSWCPNWNAVSGAVRIGQPKDKTNGAGGPMFTQIPLRLDNAGTHLHVRGFRIGRIAYSKKLRPVEDTGGTSSPEYARSWLRWEHHCLKLLRESQAPQIDPVDVLNIHVRTLLLNFWVRRKAEHNHYTMEASDLPEVLEGYNGTIGFFQDGLPPSRFDPKRSARDINRPPYREEAGQFTDAGSHANWLDHSYFVTENGRAGRGRLEERVGDDIVVLYTAPAPFILRHRPGSSIAKLIGEAYLHGCMDLDTMPTEDRGPDDWFTIG